MNSADGGTTVPGGKPVTALPGLRPTFPWITLLPVLVMVEPARIAKLARSCARRLAVGIAANAKSAMVQATTLAGNARIAIPSPQCTSMHSSESLEGFFHARWNTLSAWQRIVLAK